MKLTKKVTAIIFVAIFAASVLLAGGCSRGPKEYTDGVGNKVFLKGTPKRIVSLSPALTEAVFALGLGDRLVGVTTWCNRPAEAQNIEKVGDAFSLNTEKLVALKPDLVLVAGTKDAKAQVENDLERLGFPAWVSGPSTVAEVLKDIESLAKVLGAEKQGQELLTKLNGDLNQVKAAIPEGQAAPTVFIAFSDDLWTSGGGSFIDDVITQAGGRNVVGDINQQYLQISMEDLLVKDPDVILIAIPGGQAEGLTSRPGWSSLKAVKEGKVYFPDPDLVSRPGPSVVEGIVEVAEWLRGGE